MTGLSNVMTEAGMRITNRHDPLLDHWLSRRGLRGNPFAIWNADREPDLPLYYIDTGHFDDLLNATEPCIVFARRGCGKTAQRQQLAAQCRPLRSQSTRLATLYTDAAFDRVLAAAGDDVAELRPIHHVSELLRLGLKSLYDVVQSNDPVAALFVKSAEFAEFSAFVSQFTPRFWQDEWPLPRAVLEGRSVRELMEGFSSFASALGIEECAVLVDGLDESPSTAADSAQSIALLAPLLGKLAIVECPGFAFKFFLPSEFEADLIEHPWYRPDRIRVIHLKWHANDLQTMIGHRLAYFSQTGGFRAFSRLGQLCDDELALRVDHELVALADGLPRTALILCDTLIRTHCSQPDPPDRITPQTWDKVRVEWLRGQQVQVKDQATSPQASVRQSQRTSEDYLPEASDTTWPLLHVDESAGRIWLGSKEITRAVRPQDYRVLAFLFRHREAVCSKDTIIAEAWPDARGGVSDEALAQAIARLRENLGQNAQQAGYIETIRGRGYQFWPSGFSRPRQEPKERG